MITGKPHLGTPYPSTECKRVRVGKERTCDRTHAMTDVLHKVLLQFRFLVTNILQSMLIYFTRDSARLELAEHFGL